MRWSGSAARKLLIAASLVALCGCSSSSPANGADGTHGAPVSVAPVTPRIIDEAVRAPSSVSVTAAPVAPTTAAGPPAAERHLVLAQAIGGAISPKSVAASGTGLVFAQNMIYTHTVTVYDATGALKATIADSVRPSDFGFADRTA
ncbi:MAG: YncE family protein, partial [Acidimicrobiia bacterium]|nr:YncE family protein [Acidimicrobiia bacterium]